MIKLYFEEQEKLEKEFGKHSVVLLQNGSFHEIYTLRDKGKCKEVACDLNMLVTLQNKKEKHSEKNVYMTGFPSYNLSKNVDVLLKRGWTISIWNQHDIQGKDKKERKHYKTLTSTINLGDNENLNLNYLMCINIYNYKCNIDKIEKNDLNISILDLNTGRILGYLFNNKPEVTYDYLNEIVNIYEIKEIIYLTNNENININKILNREIKIYKKVNDENYKNINYQKEFIEKFFNTDNFLIYTDFIYTLIYLLNFVAKCEKDILNFLTNKLQYPEIHINKYNTIINSDTIYQLNLINADNNNNKYKSIYNIIDNCCTLLGKRELKKRLLNPINDVETLKLRYKKVVCLKQNAIFKNFEKYLSNIIDIERVYHRIGLKKCELIKFDNFVVSLRMCYKILKKIDKDNELKKVFVVNELLINVQKMINELEETFDFEIMKKYNLNNVKENFFKMNIIELENIENELKKNKNSIDTYIKKLIGDKEKNDWIKLMQTEKEGYYLFTSKTRFDKIMKDIDKSIKENEFTTIKLSNGIKFYNSEFKKWSNNIISLEEKLSIIIKDNYLIYLEIYYLKYNNLLEKLINFINDFDITYSNALTADKYNFIEPKIEPKTDNDISSYVKGEGVRHILIELYNQEENYVANSIDLNDIDLGYLIIAPNSCGKSSYLRSIGVSLILAQMGGFVPAKSFSYYPYNKILCKISSIDNIYESKSKFIQDIIHMNNFLLNADKNSVVLVDEFLNSTEEYSAAALTAISIRKLILKKTNFVYTSHINSIIELVKENKEVKIKHFDYNIKDNKIIFDRVLRDGTPKSLLYGIEISKFIINDKIFLSEAYELRNKLLNKDNELIAKKFSHFNNIKHINKCELCNSEISLETHHINEQKNANEYGIIITEDNIYHKNTKFNLQILCNSCHKKMHSN